MRKVSLSCAAALVLPVFKKERLMKTSGTVCILVAFAVLLTVHTVSGQSTTIDFEAEGAGAPSVFTHPEPPLTIGIATFIGGQLLLHETLGNDQTAVYATEFDIPGYGNPLIIQFAQPVNGLSLLLTNESDAFFTVSDNLGSSETLFLLFNHPHTFTLSDRGITSVSIFSTQKWDFAIDDVTYNTIVPEPATLSLLGFVALPVALRYRRRRRD